MSLWRIALTASLILALTQPLFARIYVYEVVTKSRRFQTASKMQPKAFLKYYGGPDVIYSLSVIDKIEGNDFDEATERWKLGEKNYRDLSPKAAKPNLDFYNFIWWR